MPRSVLPLCLLALPPVLAAAPQGCGTTVDSVSQTGTMSHAAGSGGAPSGGGSGGTGAGTSGDSGGAIPAPECQSRGGSCVLVDTLAAPCPPGTYDPFSGAAAFCPTDSLRRCCVPDGGVGSPCTNAEPCDSGGCLAETSGYPGGGFCSEVCQPEIPACPAWAVCLPVFFSQAMGMCMVRCSSDQMCREAWSCQAFSTQPWVSSAPTEYVCWQVGNPMSSGGLGQSCQSPADCLSSICRVDPADSVGKCTAICDDAHSCLPGYGCQPDSGCSTTGCGFCFPA